MDEVTERVVEVVAEEMHTSQVPAAFDAGLITFKPLTKVEFPVIAQGIIQHLLDQTDALTAYVSLKQVEQIAEVALKNNDLREKAILAFQGKEMFVLGAKVTTKRAVTYDYTTDSECVRLEAIIANAKAQLKARQDVLKAAHKANTNLLNMETGEVSEGITQTRNGLSLTVAFQDGGFL